MNLLTSRVNSTRMPEPDPTPFSSNPPADNVDCCVDVTAVLVSYNTRELTTRAITSLKEYSGRRTIEIWVVDNASTDGTVESLQERFTDIHFIANMHNRGFGAANNQAMAVARGRYFLLLNTDAFVHPGAIDAMLDRLEADPKIGVVGPRLSNQDGSLQQSCFAFPSPLQAWRENLWLSSLIWQHPGIPDYSKWKHNTAEIVDWVSGACILIRKETFEKIGGFDERFFMYSEETDWQRRMCKQGICIAFEPRAIVTHLGGASGASSGVSINRHFFESLDYYELKHHGLAGLILFRLAMVIGCSLRAVLWMGTWLARPARRTLAKSKFHLHAWLAARQLTNWHLGSSTGHLPGATA